MNEEIIKARKQNMKLYSFYRSVSLDLIFYYAIEFLFLTQVKNITPSQVISPSDMFQINMVLECILISVSLKRICMKRKLKPGYRECLQVMHGLG